jgi:hypothetical protein
VIPEEAHFQGRRPDAQEASGGQRPLHPGTLGSDSDLRRHGQKIASRGGKNSKKRAVVAVARKLCVLLHSLWISGEVYEPLRNAHRFGAGRRRLREAQREGTRTKLAPVLLRP